MRIEAATVKMMQALARFPDHVSAGGGSPPTSRASCAEPGVARVSEFPHRHEVQLRMLERVPEDALQPPSIGFRSAAWVAAAPTVAGNGAPLAVASVKLFS